MEGLQVKCSAAAHAKQFTAIFQIQDQDNKTIQISWLDGEIVPDQYMRIESSWIPQESGRYTITEFTWESIDNPTPLIPPASLTVNVT